MRSWEIHFLHSALLSIYHLLRTKQLFVKHKPQKNITAAASVACVAEALVAYLAQLPLLFIYQLNQLGQ